MTRDETLSYYGAERDVTRTGWKREHRIRVEKAEEPVYLKYPCDTGDSGMLASVHI